MQHLEARMRKTEADINQLKGELQRCRPGTSQHTMYRRRALAAMKERKRIEQQLNSQYAMQNNLHAVQDAKYQVEEAKEHSAMLQEQNRQMKSAMQTVNPDAIADLQDDMRDNLADTQEVTELLGQDYGVDGIDDAELDAELEGLGEELGFSENVGASATPSYLPGGTAASSTVPSYLAPTGEPRAPQYGQ